MAELVLLATICAVVGVALLWRSRR